MILGDFESEAEQNCHGYNCKDPIQMIEVEKTLKTGYDVNSLQNDIAVLKLKHPARLNGQDRFLFSYGVYKKEVMKFDILYF